MSTPESLNEIKTLEALIINMKKGDFSSDEILTTVYGAIRVGNALVVLRNEGYRESPGKLPNLGREGRLRRSGRVYHLDCPARSGVPRPAGGPDGAVVCYAGVSLWREALRPVDSVPAWPGCTVHLPPP